MAKRTAHSTSKRRSALPRRIFMTDEARGATLPASRSLTHGDAIIMRHYNSQTRQKFLRTIAQFCRKHHITLLVAEGNDGLKVPPLSGRHLPAHLLRSARRSFSGRRSLRTAAIHNMRELGHANRAKLDACLISPVFATGSHKDARPLGLHRFARLARLAACPAYALGGLHTNHARIVTQLPKVAGVAGISLFQK